VRVGVISDSHGAMNTVVQAINEMGKIDALIHAGDFYSDAERIRQLIKKPVYAVPGNCDVLCQGPEELVITLGSYKTLITHGHLYRVKSTLQMLYYRAQELKVQLVVFGHTHVPVSNWEDNVYLFNPGSTSHQPPNVKASFGILDIGEDYIKGELLTLQDL